MVEVEPNIGFQISGSVAFLSFQSAWQFTFQEQATVLHYQRYIRNQTFHLIARLGRWTCQHHYKKCRTQQWPQDWKRSVFILIPKKGNDRECSNDHTFALISLTSQLMLKFSKPGFTSTWTMNIQVFKLDLEKAEEQEIKLRTSAGSLKKQESNRKASSFPLLTKPKPLTV